MEYGRSRDGVWGGVQRELRLCMNEVGAVYGAVYGQVGAVYGKIMVVY